MATSRLEAAVAAAVLPAEQEFGELLRSIVVVARAIFGAKASSIFLFDEESDELVFAALAGEDEQDLVGTQIFDSIPLIVEICGGSPHFFVGPRNNPLVITKRA